jgi:PAS domain S-box-containing protein
VPCTYRELFDAVEDIIYIRDLAGVILDINEAGARFFGRPRDQIVGRTFHSTPMDDRAMSLMETNLSLLESGRDRSVVELENGRGDRVPFEVTTSVVKDRTGNPAGAYGIMREVRTAPGSARPTASTMLRLRSGTMAAVPPKKDTLTDSALFSGGTNPELPSSGGWDPEK